MRAPRVLAASLLTTALACWGRDSEPVPWPFETPTPAPSPSPSPGASPAPSPSPSPSTPSPPPGGVPTPAGVSTLPSPAPGTPAPPPPGNIVRWSAAAGGPVAGVGGDAGENVYAAVATGSAAVERFVRQGRVWSLDVAAGGVPLQLTAMPSGDAVVAVCSQQTCAGGDPTARLSLVRITPAGQRRWTRAVDGDVVLSLDSDARGRTLATVGTWDAGRNDVAQVRAVIIEDGGQTSLDHPLDVLRAVAEFGGPSGDFAVGGQDAATGKPVFARVGSDGSVRWRYVLDTPAGAIDRIAFAEDGTIAVAGWFEERLGWAGVHHRIGAGFASGFLALARGDGSPLWAQDGPELRSGGAGPAAVRLGRDNDVFVHTTTGREGQSTLASFTQAGEARWRLDFGGAGATFVGAVAVARDGDLVVGVRNAAEAPFQGLEHGGDSWFVAVLAR